MSTATVAPVDATNELSDLASHPDFRVPDVKTTRYHLGIYESDPPTWFINVAGVTFPVMSSTFDKNDREIRRSGDFVDLSVDQVKRVRDALRHLFVRWRTHPETGDRIEANVYDRRAAGFAFQRGDEPLAKYLYFRKAPPEVETPKLSENLIAQLDAAIVEAEKAEEHGAKDQRDGAERDARTRQKRAGRPADDGI